MFGHSGGVGNGPSSAVVALNQPSDRRDFAREWLLSMGRGNGWAKRSAKDGPPKFPGPSRKRAPMQASGGRKWGRNLQKKRLVDGGSRKRPPHGFGQRGNGHGKPAGKQGNVRATGLGGSDLDVDKAGDLPSRKRRRFRKVENTAGRLPKHCFGRSVAPVNSYDFPEPAHTRKTPSTREAGNRFTPQSGGSGRMADYCAKASTPKRQHAKDGSRPNRRLDPS